MIKQLSIENFAIFKDVTVEFNEGLNIITGESGAGKSVLVNALSLISGARAYKEMIRNESTYAKVEAVFELNKSQKDKLSIIADLESYDNTLVITRQIWADQKSVCKINGRIRNLSTLIDAAGVLMDIHGQYENQSLLNEKNHLKYLDMFSDNIKIIKDEYEKNLISYNQLVEYIVNSSGSNEQREREKSILEFQISEISESKIENENIEEIQSRINILENAEKYKKLLYEAVNLLEGSEGENIENLIHAARQLDFIRDFAEVTNVSKQLNECYYMLKDNLHTIKGILHNIEFDPAEFDELNDRMEVISKILKKYGKTKEEVIEYKNNAYKKLDELNNFENIFNTKLDSIKKYEKVLLDTGEEITAIRKENALILENKIITELQSLEMKDVEFKIVFNPLSEKNKLGFTYFFEEGLENCEFYISTNKGMNTMPLKKIASGGEISRVMLALKGIISSKDEIFTVIFDEIDTGISGQTAVMAGEKLKKLSNDKQVICITHSPQIVAKGKYHYVIGKKSSNNETSGEITLLQTYSDRVNELARILDGNNVSKQGIEHAKNILEIKE